MSNLQFFKGRSSALPSTANRKAGAFYLTEDTFDFYYSDNFNELKRLAADPSRTIKELHTYYSLTSNTKPTSYPPDLNYWSQEIPSGYLGGEPLYGINCIVYMDGTFSYSDINSFITNTDIDNICK